MKQIWEKLQKVKHLESIPQIEAHCVELNGASVKIPEELKKLMGPQFGMAVYPRSIYQQKFENFISFKQVHGTTILNNPETSHLEADGFFVSDFAKLKPEVKIGIHTADCVPVFIKGKNSVIGLHCGWRGVAQQMHRKGSQLIGSPEDKKVFIGPSLGPCCFEIGPDTVDFFLNQSGGDYFVPKKVQELFLHKGTSDRWFMDLQSLIVFDFLEMGFAPENILVMHSCTKCCVGVDLVKGGAFMWPSYRRHKPWEVGLFSYFT